MELEINRLKADRLGLAIVVICGLITATVLILFILPSLYRRFEMAGVLRELARG